jgi:hypothetical protein
MHSTRTSSMRHLPKDERERRVREAAAVAGADGAVGEAAAFLTEIKVAHDEPLTGDQHDEPAGTIGAGTGLPDGTGIVRPVVAAGSCGEQQPRQSAAVATKRQPGRLLQRAGSRAFCVAGRSI